MSWAHTTGTTTNCRTTTRPGVMHSPMQEAAHTTTGMVIWPQSPPKVNTPLSHRCWPGKWRGWAAATQPVKEPGSGWMDPRPIWESLILSWPRFGRMAPSHPILQARLTALFTLQTATGLRAIVRYHVISSSSTNVRSCEML